MSLLLALIAAAAQVQPAEATARWRKDVAVTRDVFLEKDKSYTPEQKAAARVRLERLDKAVPELTDQQIVAELARVAALAGNAHTRAYLLRNRGWWRRYPIRIWQFADGWRIVAVRPGQEALLGARITHIGGKRVAAAEKAVRPLFAGPETWGAYMATYSLTSPDALLGTNVIRGDGRAEFRLEKEGRGVTAMFAPVEEPRRTAPEESWWFLAPAHPALKGWRHVLEGRPTAPYLHAPERWYSLRACEGGILYLTFSRAEDQPGGPTLAEFGTQVIDAIAAAPAAKLVIDLRFNTGGNLQKTRPLFEQIARSPVGTQPGRLFVIQGPATFSAGMTPTAILKQDGRPTLVGSEPGDYTTFWAEGGNVPLPNSGITMHYADRSHVYAADNRAIPDDLLYLRLNAGSLHPDRPAKVRFADYLAGRDPYAERIVAGGLRCSH